MPIEITTAAGTKHVIEIAEGESEQTVIERIRKGADSWIRATASETTFVKVDAIVSIREVSGEGPQLRTLGTH
jgi:hypothetical protein